MGFNMMQNFNLPYFSTSIKEFWTRWHISLSTWFRDYVYVPLGGNRVAEWRWLLNLMIVFVVSGLWHGAKWTFIIWGALHGTYLIVEILLNKIAVVRNSGKSFFGKAVKFFITFHLVVFGWIFFRANSVQDAMLLLNNMLDLDFSSTGLNVPLGYGNAMLDKMEVLISFAMIAVLFLVNRIEMKTSVNDRVQRLMPAGRWLVYYAAVMLIFLFGNYSKRMDFIYFQF
jgi:alginate O-acetyltransferase complex protein AlgI